MRKVIGIGETILDIIFRNNRPHTAVPGGSTFNEVFRKRVGSSPSEYRKGLAEGGESPADGESRGG